MTVELTTSPGRYEAYPPPIRKEAVWTPRDFLITNRSERRLQPDFNFVMPEILEENYLHQLDPAAFVEFKQPGFSVYSAQQMREDGCGICALHTVNVTLGGSPYLDIFPSVGYLARQALALHKNDLMIGSVRVKRGTPVYNTTAGWYHDAMLYVTREYVGLETFRQEGLGSLEQVASECFDRQNVGKKMLAIVSVRNEFWRREGGTASRATHLVIVNGFETDSNGKLIKIRVTDPYIDPNPEAPKNKINEWLVVDERLRLAFRGKAMYFLVE